MDSSNLDPVGPWEAGNQLVALNYQTPGVSMQLNHGKFMENGNCGYVLKPAYMLDENIAPKRNIRYTIRVISGRRLPKPGGASRGEVIDPYVQVTLHEPRGTKNHRTRTISDNGYNPVWNEVEHTCLILIFLTLYRPSLMMSLSLKCPTSISR